MILPFLKTVENWPLSIAVAESDWMFPTIECVHVIAIAIVVGAIFRLDLRMIGVDHGRRSIAEVSDEILPWVWSAFSLAAISGLLMFISAATKYAGNTAFLFKLVFLALAGMNMITFHLITERQPAGAPVRTTGVKIAGGLSMVFWGIVVILGRWIGFL